MGVMVVGRQWGAARYCQLGVEAEGVWLPHAGGRSWCGGA